MLRERNPFFTLPNPTPKMAGGNKRLVWEIAKDRTREWSETLGSCLAAGRIGLFGEVLKWDLKK
jgi:hypothetical protein